MEADFGGWATKTGLRCTDGRTIMSGAFKHMHDKQVPLVYQHSHNDAKQVLGHAILEHRDEGVYAYAFFNETEQGKNAKELVRHRDIRHLSIYANQLDEDNKKVTHGNIREVSLVLAGANPGAVIDYVSIKHSDGAGGYEITDLDDEAVIHTGLELEHALDDEDETDDEQDDDEKDEREAYNMQHADDNSDLTVQDIYDGMTDAEKDVVHYLIGTALEGAAGSAQHSATDEEGELIHQEGAGVVSRNVFDQTTQDGEKKKHELSHDALKGIFADAVKRGSLKEAVETYATDHLQHGITDIDILFPDAKNVTGAPELDKRRTEWVAVVLNGTRHTPFSRIKTFTADLTQDEARAKGYIKGTYKKEEWFGVTKRSTGPTTIYKKQKLDRDDILDITDFDVVAFLKGEMRLMTEEEFARAILIGDGRDISDEDKVKDPMGAADGNGIRSILNDHELFVTTLTANVDDANSSYDEIIDLVMDGMEYYKGTGTPTFFTTIPQLNKFLQAKDGMGRRLYETKQAVADALGVDKIVTVEVMKEVADLIGIIVNLDDYNVGTDRGGELSMFDDFDIDYNQYKYLMETRASGALIKPKTALVIKKTAAANVLATPVKPAFNKTTGVVTIPTTTGIDYKDSDGDTLTAGAQTALSAGASTTIYAVEKTGYYIANSATTTWIFKRDDA